MKFRHKQDDADILFDLDVSDRVVCLRAQARGGQWQNLAVVTQKDGKLLLELKPVLDVKLQDVLHENGLILVEWPKGEDR